MTGFLDSLFGMPVLRRVSETDQGPHRSATPESTHMHNIETLVPRQQKFVESTVVMVTPDYARHLRDTAHFERQRKISPANVQRLAREMQAGRFIPGLQIYICVLPDGSERIVNGNHTLEAVAASGVTLDLTVTRAPVSDIDEAGRIYAVFDLQKTRSWNDSLKATGAGDGAPNASFVLSAIGVIRQKFYTFREASLHGRQRLPEIALLEEYKTAAEMFARCIEGAPTNSARLVKRASIMAIALETLRYQPSLAFEFWQAVAQDEGLTKERPERALLHWMRNNKAGGSESRREQCAAAALAWNAAFRGEKRSFVKPNQMTSFFLLGTPYASGLRG